MKEACAGTLEALSSGNTEQMRDAADAIKQRLVASEEVDRQTLQLMSQLGIAPEEVDFARRSG